MNILDTSCLGHESSSLENKTRGQVEFFLQLLAQEGPEAMLIRNQGGQNYTSGCLIRQEIAQRLGLNIHGRLLDLGMGPALATPCWLKSFPSIRKYVGLELNSQYVFNIAPTVLSEACLEYLDKITLVRGSFNDIPFPPNSFDLVLEEDAFHHSNDLVSTLQESLRVLKPQSSMLLIDRFHPSSTPDHQLEYLLDVVNPPQFWHHVGNPSAVGYTRRDLGEHEIRIAEWRDAIIVASSKLRCTVKFSFHKFWIASNRLSEYFDICSASQWEERALRGELPGLLELPPEIGDLLDTFKGRSSNRETLNYTGECAHTLFRCSTNPSLSNVRWMCRGVIHIVKTSG
jgi:SAM-dependent methyltransferase